MEAQGLHPACKAWIPRIWSPECRARYTPLMRYGAMRLARARRMVCPLMLCLFIAACGQKGPLVLPDKQKHSPVIPKPGTPAAPAGPASAPASAPDGPA
jgi:predicted small lipoprotein YifL